jgi:thymidine phosphorylase
MNARQETGGTVGHMPPQEPRRVVDIIEATALGTVTCDDINELVNAVTDGDADDAQVGAWLMAVKAFGLGGEQAAALCAAMAASGEQLTWEGVTVDKHSTGGVGDATSLVIAPVLACLGLGVPMLSGRSLGHTGGTLDKLEAINGYRCDLSADELRRQLDTVGCFISGATETLAPADARLYQIRDRTATVASLPLIAASIVSKKLAAGAGALVLDVKWGEAAFLPERDDARLLAETMVALCQANNVPAAAALTCMDEPLGQAVGNAAEVHEALGILSGDGDRRMRELCIQLCIEAARLAGLPAAIEQVVGVLDDGTARAKFDEMAHAQGAHLPLDIAAPVATRDVHAAQSGKMRWSALRVAHAGATLGACRADAHSVVDASASIWLHVGDGGHDVRFGDVIATVGGNNEDAVEHASALLADALVESDDTTPAAVDEWVRP